jgi:hypothetical protein
VKKEDQLLLEGDRNMRGLGDVIHGDAALRNGADLVKTKKSLGSRPSRAFGSVVARPTGPRALTETG